MSTTAIIGWANAMQEDISSHITAVGERHEHNMSALKDLQDKLFSDMTGMVTEFDTAMSELNAKFNARAKDLWSKTRKALEDIGNTMTIESTTVANALDGFIAPAKDAQPQS